MSSAHDLRRALELLCRKVNPPHQIDTRRVRLADVGFPDPDLSAVPLRGAYLRGLAPGEARLADDPGQLDGAWLEGGAWERAGGLTDQVLDRATLLETGLPEGIRPGGDSLVKPSGSTIVPVTPFPRAPVQSVAVFPDGRVVGAVGTLVVVWDPGTGHPLAVLHGHWGWVRSVAVLDGDRVVSGGRDGTLRVWGVSGQEEQGVLEGHQGVVRSVAVLDGDRVVSGGEDGVRLWDLAAGKRGAWSCEAWWVALSRDVVWWADREGITITHRSRPWRTRRRGGKLLPEDEELHRYAGYSMAGRFFVPARWVPDLVEVDEANPRVCRQKWPPGREEAEIQAFLGGVRREEE